MGCFFQVWRYLRTEYSAAVIALITKEFVLYLNDLDLYVVFVFYFRLTGGSAVGKAAFRAAFILQQRMPDGIRDFGFVRLYKGCLGMTCLPAFWLSAATSGIRDDLAFVFWRLRCGRAGIAAIMVKKGLCVCKAVLQFLDNGIFFSKGFGVLLLIGLLGALKALDGCL